MYFQTPRMEDLDSTPQDSVLVAIKVPFQRRSSKRTPPIMSTASLEESKSEDLKPALNLVLCGRNEEVKTSAAKAILGQTELHSASSSSKCVLIEKKVCGRWVSVVVLPALCGKTQETVLEESFESMTLSDPGGVHAFILVLPLGPITDEDKKEFKIIQNTFSSKVLDFIMILFTADSDPKSPDVVNFLKGNKDIQELCQSCGGGHFVLNMNDKQQIPVLLDDVDKVSAQGSRCFTKDTLTKASMKRAARLEVDPQNDENQSKECLRLVLIGKTGSGKSATANTILGRKHFKPRMAPKPANTSCESATGEIDGRPVVVVNTPGLFDTTLTDDQIQKELYKCSSMLAPGPHAFLVVLQMGSITEGEKKSVELIKTVFGKKSGDYVIIIFTRGDGVAEQGFDAHMKGYGDFVQQLIKDCGGRYQVFNNEDSTDRTQVTQLLAKIEAMLEKNGGSYYSTELLGWEAKEEAKKLTQQLQKMQEAEPKRGKKKKNACSIH